MNEDFYGNVYVCKTEPLKDCIKHCTGTDASDHVTWAIPDLQRDFVWQPSKVLLLIDTIFRGWPFGTLTLLSVDVKSSLFIEPHGFICIKRNNNEHDCFVQKKEFTSEDSLLLVLDGQQRMQALSIAFGRDDAGFVLNEREWMRDANIYHYKRRNVDFRNCPVGSLYLNLEELSQAYTNANKNLSIIRFAATNVIVWGCTPFSSPYFENGKLQQVLWRKEGKQGQEKLIRLSRIWQWVLLEDVGALSDDLIREKLSGWDISPLIIEESLDAFRAFVFRIKQLQDTKISRLEIHLDHNRQVLTDDEYSKVIVNIFTRLNQAGTPLKMEEVTYAWFKRGWDKNKVGKDADKCFEELRQSCRNERQDFSVIELIEIASNVWATIGGGKIIKTEDQLKSDILLQLTRWISDNWSVFSSTCIAVAKTLHSKQIEYHLNYFSINVFSVWLSLQIELKLIFSRLNTEKEKATFDGEVLSPINEGVQRFFICSQWSGFWSSEKVLSIGKSFYPKEENPSPMDDACIIKNSFLDILNQIVEKTYNTIDELKADNRQQVIRYKTYLWVWHRLDKDRVYKWLRHTESPQVDHALAYKLWLKLLGLQSDTITVAEHSQFLKTINSLGNCILLNGGYNIAKSDQPFSEFFDWASKADYEMLGLKEEMVSPERFIKENGGSPELIKKAINDRELFIKNELKRFASGDIPLLT